MTEVERADVWLEGPEACFDRECDEYVDDEGDDRPAVERCSHIREVPPPLGVSGEDRSEPTPQPERRRDAHPGTGRLRPDHHVDDR